MHVVATAGHVDHGKSTLVRALTGIEPDRWTEERRRGLTIDLGFAWTALPSGREVAFVDVPGHERFLGNMLAGLGPAPVVMFVVAADEGWQPQSSDHRDAVAALGIEHGLVVVTKADRVGSDDVVAQARAELSGTGLRDAPVITVSAAEGTGLDDLRAALDGVLGGMPDAQTSGRVRLWVDRSFSITGAGTVVTGTLAAGSIAVGDALEILRTDGARRVAVRGLQSRELAVPTLGPVSRAAVNLRGIAAVDVLRGDALVTPAAWPTTSTVDVRRTTGIALTEAPEQLVAHVGTASVPARLRPLDAGHARISLGRPLPLVIGDRLVLRDPGRRRVLGGALVLDADPPALQRRGDGARRGVVLAGMQPAGDLLTEVARRGVVARDHLRRLGIATDDAAPGVRPIGGWLVHEPTYDTWQQRLRDAVDEQHTRDPLAAGVSRGAAAGLLGLPADDLLEPIARDAGLVLEGGHVRAPGSQTDLGPAESGVATLEQRLADAPFSAPDAAELDALGLGVRALAAAESAGRLLRLRDGHGGFVVLLPSAPRLAVDLLAALDQPFTASQARQALATTRRVAIPLLEHLDATGDTERLDAGHRKLTENGQSARGG